MDKKFKKTTERMDKPDDTLFKRQISYAGDIMHQYHRYPGIYMGPCMNEYPNALGGVPRTDSSYYTLYNGRICVMNWEDESTRISKKTFEKTNNYRINLEYFFKTDVISAITTTVPLDRCDLDYETSPTCPFQPIIISYAEMDGRKILNTMKTKIESEEVLTKVEAMNLIMIPKMFTSNQDIVLEDVCELLPKLKLDDEEFKLELIFEMRCVIHKYAKTLDDINRLEEVIGLQEAVTAKQFQDQKLIDQGIIQGRAQGAFEIALNVKNTFGIEHALKICDFTKEELEIEKLNL